MTTTLPARSKHCLCLLLFLVSISGFSQVDSAQHVNKRRLRGLVIGGAAAYGVTLAGLNHLWYTDTHRQSFRFFNDNAEWKQVDKLGHFYSAFYFSDGTSRALQACQVPARKADLWGALTGFAVLVPVEIFDGFSDAYGASTGDLVADAAGAAFYLGQSYLWNEVRIHPKFSFHRTDYAPQRPNTLGKGLPDEILKDYNGQTYWLSVDMDKFIHFPKWLNLAVGYGAQGMVYARDSQNLAAGYGAPYRQYYLSLDLDLTAFKTRSKVWNTLLFVAGMIKVPAPSVEFSARGTRFHAFYF
ncbi:YfiM family protein [Fulvivirgaceae bacterium PWU37]|uniref:YfiM family protein n=2 Tax=Dawidia soli TaxID=2782352 RepID=A0AAP2DAG0_9BACT|nr:YfiM family protein [Dawidia soli]